MFGNLRDTLFQTSRVRDKTSPYIDYICEKIGNGVLSILEGAGKSMYSVKGIENIPKGKKILLLANHPSALDYFGVKQIFNNLGIGIRFIAHKNFLYHPLTADYSRRNKLIGVQRYNHNQPEKIPGANIQNIKGIRESIRTLDSGGNIGIFICGQGYQKGMEQIFGGYRFIADKSKGECMVLPVVIKGRSITILQAKKLERTNDFYNTIENEMGKNL